MQFKEQGIFLKTLVVFQTKSNEKHSFKLRHLLLHRSFSSILLHRSYVSICILSFQIIVKVGIKVQVGTFLKIDKIARWNQVVKMWKEISFFFKQTVPQIWNFYRMICIVQAESRYHKLNAKF